MPLAKWRSANRIMWARCCLPSLRAPVRWEPPIIQTYMGLRTSLRSWRPWVTTWPATWLIQLRGWWMKRLTRLRVRWQTISWSSFSRMKRRRFLKHIISIQSSLVCYRSGVNRNLLGNSFCKAFCQKIVIFRIMQYN